MDKKDLGIDNMNALTTEDDTTCALTDMNCEDTKPEKNLGINNMNAVADDNDTTCAITNMNCLDEK